VIFKCVVGIAETWFYLLRSER